MAGTQPKELAELELVVMRGFWDDGPGTTTKARQQPDANQSKLWDVLPGRSGYWRLNVDAALQRPVIGQWLNQADTLFLTPGWKMVARDEARDRRASLRQVPADAERDPGRRTRRGSGGCSRS